MDSRKTMGALAAAAFAMAGVRSDMIQTIYTEAHRRRSRHLGPGGRRAGYSTPDDAARAARRASRWLRSPRTSGKPPTHIAEKLQILAKLAEG